MDERPGRVQRDPAAPIANSVVAALLERLEGVPPAEAVAFVLHDLFGVAFDAVAPVVGGSPAGARRLARRGRRAVRAGAPSPSRLRPPDEPRNRTTGADRAGRR
jgi:RNA polymerase sigma-70 factor (ECF subfamily)